eukprot:NODE_1407_length_2487_cov_12.153814.p1 GENE.NODE_1407_length_2487_cov_12.153814~~NODE_1407_length_2487_cov_12.153814.p1  ORF type:complete len:716 (+),score=170.39 NODE_1407_length_2487_cov_12.153814:112-2259(+)
MANTGGDAAVAPAPAPSPATAVVEPDFAAPAPTEACADDSKPAEVLAPAPSAVEAVPAAGAALEITAATLCDAPFFQSHIFDGLDNEAKDALVQQLAEIDSRLPGGGLAGYITRSRALLAEASAGHNAFAGLTVTVPCGESLMGEQGLGSSTFAEFEQLGMENAGRCAFCLVAGGLGERLGYPGIKIGITAEVTTGMTFMQLYASWLLAFQAHARATTGNAELELPLAIMTSGDTHAMTLQLFEENANFGLSETQVTFMKQELVPALTDVDARLHVKDGKLVTKPHGHGDVHALLLQHGLLKKWAACGFKWLFVFQDTNPLAFRALSALIGVSVKHKYVMNSIAVPRLPGEACGGICKLDDTSAGTSLTINVEYNQLDALLKDTPAGADMPDPATGQSPYPGNINVLLFHIPRMAECLEATGGIVPEFVNPKWADSTKTKFKSATRLECMMQDFPRLCNSEDAVGFTSLPRELCFTCVKNNLSDAAKKAPPDCALSAEAAIYECNARLLAAAGEVSIEPPEDVCFLGISAKLGARIILDPSFGISLEQLKEKVMGPMQISKRSVLILSGDVSIQGMVLDGAVKVVGSGVLPYTETTNASRPLLAISEEELATHHPSLQIRGYDQGPGDMEELVPEPADPEPSAFNGRWVGRDDGELRCDITDLVMTWPNDMPPTNIIQLGGRMVGGVKGDETASGKLDDNGDLIWDDGDTWVLAA